MALHRPKGGSGKRTPFWKYDFIVDGKRYVGSTEKTNKVDARKVESDKRQEILDGKEPTSITPIKFSELTKKYREQHAAGTKSERFYDVTLKVLERHLKDPLTTDITREDCDAFWNKRKSEVKLSTARTSLVVLKHLFTKAADWKHIRRDAIPTDGMDIPKIRNGVVRVATADEVKAILATAEAWFRPYVVLLLHGARRDEARKLDWSDVSFPAMTLVFRNTKNGTDRPIPITPELHVTLKSLPSRIQGGPVFVKDGQRITINQIRREWARICRKASIVKLRLHDCRHTWASRMLDAGVPVQTVAEQGGWQDLKMVTRYGHSTPEGVARAAVAMSGILKPSPTTSTPLDEAVGSGLKSLKSPESHEAVGGAEDRT